MAGRLRLPWRDMNCTGLNCTDFSLKPNGNKAQTRLARKWDLLQMQVVLVPLDNSLLFMFSTEKDKKKCMNYKSGSTFFNQSMLLCLLYQLCCRH